MSFDHIKSLDTTIELNEDGSFTAEVVMKFNYMGRDFRVKGPAEFLSEQAPTRLAGTIFENPITLTEALARAKE